MLKFQSQDLNTALRAAIVGYLPVLTAKICLFTGDPPDFNAAALANHDFTQPLGASLGQKTIVYGVLHNHDADFDAFHIQPVEFYGDNAHPDQAITGYFITLDADDVDSPVGYAEVFPESKLMLNALSAFTIAPLFKIPRRGDGVETTLID